jgi:hypothetical protein
MLTLRALMTKLWKDDAGSILATEYLMLGSIVALGGATGLNSLRDATAHEAAEYANSVRAVTQTYRDSAVQTAKVSRAASSSPYQSAPQGTSNDWSGAVP